MIAPICAVCGARGPDTKCRLVSFADIKTRKNKYSCQGLRWFCKIHKPRAEQLTEYNMKDAVALIKNEK